MKLLLQIALVVFILSVLTRLFIIDSFIVEGDSMSPAINDGDYVFINKLIYKFKEPERKDIVVVKVKVNDGDEIKEANLIKRIIGLPNERITLKDNSIFIREDRTDLGQILEEPYLDRNGTSTRGHIDDINLDPQEYFLLGDKRSVSIDSRDFGTADRWKIEGKIFLTLRKF